MSAFASNFAASAGKMNIDLYGEPSAGTYTPRSGSPRTVKYIIERDPPEALSGVPGTMSKMVAINVINQATDAANDGYGGISSAALDTGGDLFTLADVVGGSASARPIKRILPEGQYGGMLRLEVR